MRNHYIPQFVLREFAKGDVIHVYNKTNGKIHPSSPKDLFVIRGFYHDVVEQVFAQIESKLSGELKSILKSYRNNTALEIPDSRVLACCRQLVLLQLLRTPYSKQTGVSALDDTNAEEFVQRLAKAGYDNVDGELVRRSLQRWKEDAAKDRESRLWSLVLLQFLESPAKALPDVVPAVLGKGVLLAKAESAFVLGDRGAMSTATSDKPLSHSDREIYFPVSPDIAVSLAGPRDRITRSTLDVATTRKINTSTMGCSREWVASHSITMLASLANPR